MKTTRASVHYNYISALCTRVTNSINCTIESVNWEPFALGINGPLWLWFKLYLAGKSHLVSIEGECVYIWSTSSKIRWTSR